MGQSRDLAKVTQTAQSILDLKSKSAQLQCAQDRGKEQGSPRRAPRVTWGARVGWELESYQGGS